MYSTAEVAARASLPVSTLNTLVKTRAVRPSVESCGTGSCRRWSQRDLEVVHVVSGLLRAGLPKRLVRAVGQFLQSLGCLEPVAVDDNGRVVLASSFRPPSRFHIVIDPPKFLLPAREA